MVDSLGRETWFTLRHSTEEAAMEGRREISLAREHVARRGLSDTWLTLLSEHMVNSLFVEPLEQVPHEPGTCGSGESRSGRRSIHPRS
jgi:hypothetical protein